MPIGSYGGLILDAKNNRVYPGAGGSVGGLTPGVKNIAWIAGAGMAYESFTPDGAQLVESPEVRQPMDLEIDGGGIGPGGGWEPPIYGGGPGPGSGPVGGGLDSQPYETMPTTPTQTIIPTSISDLVDRVLSGVGIQRAGSSQPLFLYTPGQPQAQSNGGSMKNLVILAAVIFVGYMIYKRVA